MTGLERWEEYSKLSTLEGDDEFVESFIPGNSFVSQVEGFGDSEHIEHCSQLAVEGGFEYSDDQTALVYSLHEDNLLVQQGLEIGGEVGENEYEKGVRAGVNIGLGFIKAIEDIENQAGANCKTDYETPNTPHLEKPHGSTRSLAYFMEETIDTTNQGIPAGILASAYLERE